MYINYYRGILTEESNIFYALCRRIVMIVECMIMFEYCYKFIQIFFYDCIKRVRNQSWSSNLYVSPLFKFWGLY